MPAVGEFPGSRIPDVFAKESPDCGAPAPFTPGLARRVYVVRRYLPRRRRRTTIAAMAATTAAAPTMPTPSSTPGATVSSPL